MCTKVTFWTYNEAKAYFKKVENMQRKGKKTAHTKKMADFYKCDKCGNYHMTSMPLCVYEAKLIYSPFFT